MIGGVAAYVAPAAVPFIVHAAQKVSVTGPSVAVSLLAKAEDPKLRRIIDAVHRVTAKIGSGKQRGCLQSGWITSPKISGLHTGTRERSKEPEPESN